MRFDEKQTDVLAVAFIVAIGLSVYLTTMCPTVFWYDSAEFVAAAHTLGIPHPPGAPLYVLVAHLFSWLPGDPAGVINAFSAVSAAVAVGLTYLVVRNLGVRPSGAVLSSIFVGTGPVFWFNALIAEVYAPALAVLLGVLLLLLRGKQHDDGRWFVAAAFSAGLGLGFHLGIATCGLGFAVLVMSLGAGERLSSLLSSADLARRLRWAVASSGAALAGACIFLWLPIRASMSPRFSFDQPPTWDAFWWFLSGGPYRSLHGEVSSYVDRSLWLADQVLLELSLPGAALAVVGFAWLVRKRPVCGLAWVLCVAGNVWFFFDYFPHDAHVFFLPTYVLLGCMVGPSLEWITTSRRWVRPLAVAAVAVCGAHKFGSSFVEVDLGDYTEAADWGTTACADLPSNAIVVSFSTPQEWKLEMVLTAYYQTVLGRRQDVMVVRPAGPRTIASWTVVGRPVFALVPWPQLADLFELRPEAGMYRIGRPRVPVGQLVDWVDTGSQP